MNISLLNLLLFSSKATKVNFPYCSAGLTKKVKPHNHEYQAGKIVIAVCYKDTTHSKKDKNRSVMWNEWRSNRSSPWNDETAQLPEQFYRPIVSHLSHQPSNSEPCVFFVSSFILCQCPRCENPSSEKLKCRPKCRRVSSVWSRHMGGGGWHYAWMHLAVQTVHRDLLSGDIGYLLILRALKFILVLHQGKKKKDNYIQIVVCKHYWIIYLYINVNKYNHQSFSNAWTESIQVLSAKCIQTTMWLKL